MSSVSETVSFLEASRHAGLYSSNLYAIITVDFDRIEAEEVTHVATEVEEERILNGIINIRAKSSSETEDPSYKEFLKRMNTSFVHKFGYETPHPDKVRFFKSNIFLR